MKTKIIFFLALMFCGVYKLNAQIEDYIDSASTYMIKPYNNGFMWWVQPNPFTPGHFFESYEAATGDVFNEAVLEKVWVDSFVNMTHYRYQQTYKGLSVEGAHMMEHFSPSGSLILTNAKLAINLDMNVQPTLSRQSARSALLNSLDQNWVFAWEDQSWEAAIVDDSGGDTTATWNPSGDLMIALDHYANLGFLMDSSRYRLAYQFDVRVISPNIYMRYWVDANTGVVFKSLSLMDQDGLADVINSDGGTQTIDTRWRGFPNFDYVLETNNDEVRIHCKKSNGNPFPWRAEIDKDDEPWIGFESDATTAYWYTRETWIFFKEVYERSGMDDNNGRIRLHVDHPTDNGQNTVYFLTEIGNINNIRVDSYYGTKTGNYQDVVAHEYTHGVVKHTAGLIGSDEPGALNESFCDIFGVLTERYTKNGELETNIDWQFGHPDIFSRSLEDPKSDGRHGIDDCLDEAVGQPDTYLGEFWVTDACPSRWGDKHAKGGVQNYWFYLLSEGGWGTNDNGDVYTVLPIGETKAALLSYWNMTNTMMPSSEYAQAREGTISAAVFLFGECSFEHNQVMNAWHAVGVGEASNCANASIASEKQENFLVYPNPVTDYLTVSWDDSNDFDIKIYNLSGSLVFNQQGLTNNQQISFLDFAKGTYIIEVSNAEKILRKKVIKN